MKHALLLLLAFLAAGFCLSRTSAQTPPSPPLTGKIAHITILGTKNIPVDTVRAVLTLKVGNTYTPEAAAKDAAAIKSMGVFNAATVAATPVSLSSVDLNYTVIEFPVVQGIKFTADTPSGLPSVPAAQLIAQMKTSIGQVLNTTVLTSDLDKLFNRGTGYFSKQGYFADVSANISIEPKNGIITIPLLEYHIQSIQITGNSRVKTAEILAQMHTKAGDIYDSNALNGDLSTIYATGSFRQVKDWNWTVTGAERVGVTIPVVEQPAAMGILDEKQAEVVPFLYGPPTNPFPVVQVSVNGKPPLPFIVDTGTSFPLSLDTWAVKKLGLTTSGPLQKNDDGVAFQKAPVRSFVFGSPIQKNNIVFKPEAAAVLDLSILSQIFPGQPIAGIVGMGALGLTTSRFDFVAKKLTIFPQAHAPLHIPGGVVLPLTVADGLVAVRATLAPGMYANLIVDTGSDSTQLPLSALDVLHPTAASYGSFYGRIDAIYVCPTVRLTKLEIGSLSVPNVVVGTLPPPTRLSLGMDILAGYRMTLDGPNGQLILEPSAHSGRYIAGWSGVDIVQANHGWKVATLQYNSPARLAGLQAGDQIVAANGLQFDGLTEFQAKDVLGGISGKPLQVIAKRGAAQDKNITISWTALDAFSAPVYPMNGLTLEKRPDAPWIIQKILRGCPGDLAGLQVGDAIMRVQGEAVAKMTIEQYGDLVKQPTVVLEMERKDVAKPFTVRLSAPK